jgi:hypothetical protein
VERRSGRMSHTWMVLSDEPEIRTSSCGMHNKDLRKSEWASVVDISRADCAPSSIVSIDGPQTFFFFRD